MHCTNGPSDHSLPTVDRECGNGDFKKVTEAACLDDVKVPYGEVKVETPSAHVGVSVDSKTRDKVTETAYMSGCLKGSLGEHCTCVA